MEGSCARDNNSYSCARERGRGGGLQGRIQGAGGGWLLYRRDWTPAVPTRMYTALSCCLARSRVFFSIKIKVPTRYNTKLRSGRIRFFGTKPPPTPPRSRPVRLQIRTYAASGRAPVQMRRPREKTAVTAPSPSRSVWRCTRCTAAGTRAAIRWPSATWSARCACRPWRSAVFRRCTWPSPSDSSGATGPRRSSRLLRPTARLQRNTFYLFWFFVFSHDFKKYVYTPRLYALRISRTERVARDRQWIFPRSPRRRVPLDDAFESIRQKRTRRETAPASKHGVGHRFGRAAVTGRWTVWRVTLRALIR